MKEWRIEPGQVYRNIDPSLNSVIKIIDCDGTHVDLLFLNHAFSNLIGTRDRLTVFYLKNLYIFDKDYSKKEKLDKTTKEWLK